MDGADTACLEAAFFRTLNSTVEPLVRAGFGSPVLLPVGAIVVETKGRRSGRTFNVPLLATRTGDLILVSTARGARSQWLKNLAARPDVRYWLAGSPRDVTAFVFAPGQASVGPAAPVAVRYVASLAMPCAAWFGLSFAILSPRSRVAVERRGERGPAHDVVQHS